MSGLSTARYGSGGSIGHAIGLAAANDEDRPPQVQWMVDRSSSRSVVEWCRWCNFGGPILLAQERGVELFHILG